MEMLMNGSDNEKLFSKVVPVSVKDVYSNDARVNHLFLSMEWQEALSGMYSPKVLSISLTDNDDPFFLYNMQLTKEDFQALKEKEDLLIDFSAFPQHIINYIERCLQEDKNPDNIYLLAFNVSNMAGEAQLEIVERNKFKRLNHLSLKFIAANESAVRQYLVSNFRCLKEERRRLRNDLAFMERDLKDKLAACQTKFTSKVQELEEAIKQLKIESNEKEHKYQMELQEERDRYISRHKDEVNRLEKEFQEKECKYVKEIKQNEKRVNILEALNKELNDKIFKNESTIKELESKLRSLEEEKTRLKEHLQNSKHKYDHLQSEIKEKQSCIRQQDEKISDLQQELRSKVHSISKLEDQIESEIELKKSIENELENIKFQLEMSERTRQDLENEKERLNGIIVGLQEKSKELTKEEKSKNHLVSKYKKIIEEKDRALLDTKQKINELNIDLKAENAEIKHLTESNYTLQNKLDDLAKKCKDQENVIKWLNRQMTDNCVVPSYNVPPHLTSPSALAQKQLAKVGSENSPPLTIGKNAATKSVRIDATPPVCKQNNSTPSQFHRTAGTDSAYRTASLHCSQATPEILAGNHNMIVDPSNFEIDQEALSAAFRNDGGGVLRHSTAKKPTRPVKSTTPKNSKKR